MPYSLKDLAVTKGIPTGRGSLVWGVDDAGFDAPVAERLAAAGGVLLGKTTTPEMGWKGDSGNRRNGPCHNPWRHGRTPGGSAAAGRRRGGRIRAAAPGLGRRRLGAHPGVLLRRRRPEADLRAAPQYPPSAVETVSHIGPITRTVADTALMLDAMAGLDERDRTSLDPPCASYHGALAAPLEPLRIAFSPDLGFGVVEPGVAARVAEAVDVLRGLGHRVEDVELALDDPWWIEETIWDTGMAACMPTGSPRCATCSTPASSPWSSRASSAPASSSPAPTRRARPGSTGCASRSRATTCSSARRCRAWPSPPATITRHCRRPRGDLPRLDNVYVSVQPFGRCRADGAVRLRRRPAVGLQIVGRRFADELVLRLGAGYEAAVGSFSVPSL